MMTIEALPAIEWLIVEPDGRMGFREVDGRAYLHCDVWKWSPRVRRACAVKWPAVKREMRARGFAVLYSVVPDEPHVRKWQEMFGQRLLRIKNGLCLYSQEI